MFAVFGHVYANIQNEKEKKEKSKEEKKYLEMPGIEPGASHMRSERSTTELHPHCSRVPI